MVPLDQKFNQEFQNFNSENAPKPADIAAQKVQVVKHLFGFYCQKDGSCSRLCRLDADIHSLYLLFLFEWFFCRAASASAM